MPLTFFLQISWPTPTDVQALWKGLANILRNIHILDISSPCQRRCLQCTHIIILAAWFMILGFWWGILGKLHHWCLTQVQITFFDRLSQTVQKIYYNVTAYDIMAWSPPAAMWETRGTLILGWNDLPQGFQRPMRRTLPRWDWLQQNNLIDYI